MDSINTRIEDCRRDNYQHIDLSNLNLDNFPDLPQDILDNVHFCTLSDNNLTELKCPNFKKLKILDVGHNKIHKIISIPNTLEEFVCRKNILQDIRTILSCPKLERIDCTDNLLINIPECISLKIIYSAYNQLIQIPSIKTLEKIICHNNQIESIKDLPNLIYIDARNNKIHKIINCPKLKQLYINNNKLILLDNLRSLEYLECIHNNLEKIPYFDNIFEILCDYNIDNKPICLSVKYKDRVENIKQYNEKYCCIKMKKIVK